MTPNEMKKKVTDKIQWIKDEWQLCTIEEQKYVVVIVLVVTLLVWWAF